MKEAGRYTWAGWFCCFSLCVCIRRADAHLRAHLLREEGAFALSQGCVRSLRHSQRYSCSQTSFYISAFHFPRPTPTAWINLGRTMFILTVHLSTSACWVNGQIYCLTRWAVSSQAASSLPTDSLGWRGIVNMKSTDLGPAGNWGRREGSQPQDHPCIHIPTVEPS